VGLTVLSATLWAGYSVAIGLFFGQWFEHNHLLGAVIAILCAIVLGVLVDFGISKIRGTLPVELKRPVPPTEQ
jgi:membrane protein DedA with SNARE-associated domain